MSAFYFVRPTAAPSYRVASKTLATRAMYGPGEASSASDPFLAMLKDMMGSGSGSRISEGDPQTTYNIVAPIYKAVRIRGAALSSIPFTINKGSKVVYDSDSEDPVPDELAFLGDPGTLFRLAEMALATVGYVRCHKEHPAGTRRLTNIRWYNPLRITFDARPTSQGGDVDPDKGIIRYRRKNAAGRDVLIPAEDVLAIDYPDPFVELGSGSPPLRAAFEAARIHYGYTSFVGPHMEGGMLKNFAFVFHDPSGKGRVPDEGAQTKFKGGIWRWLKSRGRPKSPEDIQVLSEHTDVKEFGEGIQSLSDRDMMREAWVAVGAAFGIPESTMLSSAANYATRMLDKLEMYEGELFADADLIQHEVNEQVLMPMGYSMKFHKKRVEAVQFAEVQKAQALMLLAGGVPIITRQEAREDLGKGTGTPDASGDGVGTPEDVELTPGI